MYSRFSLNVFIGMSALILLIGCSSINTAPEPPVKTTTEKKTKSLKTETPIYMAFGTISSSELLNKYPKFKSEYNDYTVSSTELNRLKKIEQPTNITVVFGTWCHDSEREVPRIIKLLEQSNNPNLKLELIAVKYNKQLPDGMPSKYQVLYTPTLYLEQNNNMLGSIIERPDDSWASHIDAILAQ